MSLSAPTPSTRPAASPPADAPGQPVVERFVVWVGHSPQAEALVRYASQLARGADAAWTVINVDTPGTVKATASQRVHALRALQLAERLGAATASVSADSVVSAVVERARHERATMVLVGGKAPDGRLGSLHRYWLGTLADVLSTRLPDVVVNVVSFPDDGTREPIADAEPERPASSMGTWLHAVAVVALCIFISDVMLPYLELASVATVFLAGVVYVALRLGQSAAILAVLLSIFAFDLMFVMPRWSLAPIEPQYYFTFLVMLVVGMLISRLAENARQQAQVAEARAARAQALNELARNLVSAPSVDEIGRSLTNAVQTTFGAVSALMLPDDRGALHDAARGDRPPGEPGDAEASTAQQAFDEDRSIDLAGEPGIDGSTHYLPLSGSSGPLGTLVVRGLPLRFGTPEDRHLLESFANQAALALERALFERRSAAAVVAAEAERLRNTVLAGISHDFRTPLTTIVGAATSLRDQGDALDAVRRRRLLDGILTEARRMHGGMSDLLDLTRMEQGGMRVECEWCPADELIEEALEALGARLNTRTVRAVVDPEAVVWCDPRLVGQALRNLLDNALRYTPARSSIEVRIELDGPSWRLVVADDGPGLPAGREDEVFKKFFRGREEATGSGTGLGLAICAAVAHLHQGRIAAANAGGACFTLTLPQPAAPSPARIEAA